MVKRRSSHTKRRKHRGAGFFDGLFGTSAPAAVPLPNDSQGAVGGPVSGLPPPVSGSGYGGRSRRRSRKTKRRSRRGGKYY